MPFNGSGTFVRSAGQPVVSGTVISSTTFNTYTADVANNGLSNCITKDGQTTVTQDIPFNSNRLTGVGDATGLADALNVKGLQNGSFVNLGSVSGTDTITATVTPVPSAYASGQMFVFIPANANTGATTINISSLGAKNIFLNGSALSGGELPAGVPVGIRYDGTQFEVMFVGGVMFNGVLEAGNGVYTPNATGEDKGADTANFSEYYQDGEIIRGVSADGVLAPHHNLTIENGTTPAKHVDVKSTELIVTDSNGKQKFLSSVNETDIDITGSGAGGLDTGSEASSTWYHIWIIAKPDGTVAGLLSVSDSSPTMPTGYTFKGYVGAIYNGSGSDFPTLRQRGKQAFADNVDDLSGGASSSSAAVDLTVPVTANKVYVTVQIDDDSNGNAAALLSPLDLDTFTSFGSLRVRTQGLSGSQIAFWAVSIPLWNDQRIFYTAELGTVTITTAGWEYA